MSNSIPNDAYAIIIGAMKCGTTSLYSYLQGHPEICPAIKKEPEFFSEHQRHGVLVENYADLWDFDASLHRYALEASTGYTKYPSEPNVPANIHRYGIEPKFIYIIRNPFDRMQSFFNHLQNSGSSRIDVLDKRLLVMNNYFVQLERYRAYFPQERILILDFDELRENPRLLLKRVYRFLGISDSYYPQEFEVKNPTMVRSLVEKKIAGSRFAPLLSHTPAGLKRLGKRLLRKTTPRVNIRKLNEAENEFIRRELAEEMIKLQQVYGVDVSRWGF